MKFDRLQKRILIILIVLCLITPLGILFPMFFNAGDAWGEWSAETVRDLVGYVPEGLAKYSDLWQSPMTDYTLNAGDKSVVHQSGYYIVAGLIGATLTCIVMIIISKLIVRNEK
jgi:cobalt/nickel transport protein